jgi:small basic protein (TIGR04137 family)
MSVHKSLRTGGSLSKHRNVLKRVERIKVLEEGGEWREGQHNVLGLRKVKSIKVAAKKKARRKTRPTAQQRPPRVHRLPPPSRPPARRSNFRSASTICSRQMGTAQSVPVCFYLHAKLFRNRVFPFTELA